MPLFFALMTRKKRQYYVRFFRARKEKVDGEMKVQQLVADFELPVHLEFPNSVKNGLDPVSMGSGKYYQVIIIIITHYHT